MPKKPQAAKAPESAEPKRLKPPHSGIVYEDTQIHKPDKDGFYLIPADQVSAFLGAGWTAPDIETEIVEKEGE